MRKAICFVPILSCQSAGPNGHQVQNYYGSIGIAYGSDDTNVSFWDIMVSEDIVRYFCLVDHWISLAAQLVDLSLTSLSQGIAGYGEPCMVPAYI